MGCAPVPVNKTFTMWPKRTIRVVDAETGKPVEGAKVRLVRYQHPHRREDEVKTLKTGESGEVSITYESKSIRTFPLMMHGVPGFSWDACAEADGHAGTSVYMGDESAPLVIKLPVGSRPCDGKLDNTAPANDKLRIEGVEKDGARWILTFVMVPTRKVKKGDAIGAVTIDEVMFQSEPHEGSTIRRARVAVTGDASALRYGDLVAAP
jgi:hypothetical protein